MKKHLSFVAVILLMIATHTLFAQGNKNVIHTLSQSIRSHKSMEVSFTYQTVGDPNQSEEVKEGQAYFQDKAYKVILADQQTISDGTTTWRYLVADEEVMVGNVSEDDSPFKVLDEIERDSSGLTPIMDQKGNLKGLEIEMDEGVKLILSITEMKFDKDYKEGFFTFDEKAHPEVDVIDMR